MELRIVYTFWFSSGAALLFLDMCYFLHYWLGSDDLLLNANIEHIAARKHEEEQNRVYQHKLQLALKIVDCYDDDTELERLLFLFEKSEEDLPVSRVLSEDESRMILALQGGCAQSSVSVDAAAQRARDVRRKRYKGYVDTWIDPDTQEIDWNEYRRVRYDRGY